MFLYFAFFVILFISVLIICVHIFKKIMNTMKSDLNYMYLISICLLGFSIVTAQQKYKERINALEDFTCSRVPNFVSYGQMNIYYSYYYCHYSSNGSDPFGQVPVQRSTIFFIGTPGTSGSGYFEYLAMDTNLEVDKNSVLLQNFDLVFIDAPAVGFSSVNNRTYIYSVVDTIEVDLCNAIIKILNEHPVIYSSYFYLYAESYGAKYLSGTALALYKVLPVDVLHSFQGIFLASPFIDPKYQLAWSNRLYQQGFIDISQRGDIGDVEDYLYSKIEEREYIQAASIFKSYEEIVHSKTKGVNKCDLTTNVCLNDIEGRGLKTQIKELRSLVDCEESNYYVKLQRVMNARKPHGFEGLWGQWELSLIKFLGVDLMVSGSYFVSRVLNETDLEVTIISGQNDLVAGPPSVYDWLDNLEWSGAPNFYDAPHEVIRYAGRQITRSSCGDIIGYKKRFGQLSVFTLKDTGHRIFFDRDVQPLRKLETVFGLASGLQSVDFNT